MRIAICDDDEQELAHLWDLITKYQLNRGKNIDCHSFPNSIDFLCDLKGGEYDLILLGAPMVGTDGLQAGQELRKLDKNVEIIFVSSSPEFAVESYSVGAYYYLLKPVEASSLFPLLDSMECKLSASEEQGFVLKSRKGIVRVSYAKLEFVEVMDKTVSFHLTDGIIHEVTASLADFEEKLLDRTEFFKTHRSYLVNLNYVQAIGPKCVVTKNGQNIPVSRQRRNPVQKAYIHLLQQTEAKRTKPAKREAISSKRPDGAWRILLVDDDATDRTYWADLLRAHNCIVYMAGNGEDACKLVTKEACDCILLDVKIPGEDGFSICERIHRLTDIPVIFLSCLTESDSQLEGFAVGGIDYITKDTPPELFWAKVATRIKLAMADQTRTQFHYGPLLLDLSRRRAQIEAKELPLTSDEFDILWRLSKYAGRIFTLEEIYEWIGGSQLEDSEQTVQIHMSRLRRKLDKECTEHRFIETVWGKGYRFVPIDKPH